MRGPEGGYFPSGYQHIPHADVAFALGSALDRKLKTSEELTLATCSVRGKEKLLLIQKLQSFEQREGGTWLCFWHVTIMSSFQIQLQAPAECHKDMSGFPSPN